MFFSTLIGFLVMISLVFLICMFEYFSLYLRIWPSVIIPIVLFSLFFTIKIPSFFSLKILIALFILIFSLTKGIFFPTNIISSTVFSWAPKLPDGCSFLKSNLPNFLYCIVAIANASPKASWVVVLDVGTIPPASCDWGIKSLMSDALYKTESFFETIPINNILFLFAYLIMFFNSSVWPE